MNEIEWCACDDPAPMLLHLLRYNPQAGTVAGEKVGFLATDRQFRLLNEALLLPLCGESRYTVGSLVIEGPAGDCLSTAVNVTRSYRPVAAALVRCVVGNPFRPVPALWDSVKAGDEVLVEAEPNYHLVKRRTGQRPASAEVIEVRPDGKVRVQPAYGGSPGVWEAPRPEPAVEWLTPTVLALAAAAYLERPPDGALDPARLGVLADALEEAGCADGAILAHLRRPIDCRACRNTGTGTDEYSGTSVIPGGCPRCGGDAGPHVRGCHAVDLLLGES